MLERAGGWCPIPSSPLHLFPPPPSFVPSSPLHLFPSLFPLLILPLPHSHDQGAEIGTFVYQVNATDIDAGLNAVLSYSITGGNTGGNTEDVFSISSDDGRVTVKTSPDRENDFGIINTYTVRSLSQTTHTLHYATHLCTPHSHTCIT